MAFSRVVAAAAPVAGDELTAALVGIGVQLAAVAKLDANIEDSLVGASTEGMERDDLRVLALVAEWLAVHHPRVNADRLLRLVQAQESRRVRAFWAAWAAG